MKILFDQGTPVPLRHELPQHEVTTLHEKGWSELNNGELLKAAEKEFEPLITTDQNLQHQQNLKNLRLAIMVLPTTSWPRIQRSVASIHAAFSGVRPGVVNNVVFTIE